MLKLPSWHALSWGVEHFTYAKNVQMQAAASFLVDRLLQIVFFSLEVVPNLALARKTIVCVDFDFGQLH